MLVDTLFSAYIKYRLKRIDLYRDFPLECQQKVWLELLRSGSRTAYGKDFNFSTITHPKAFQASVPLSDFSSLEPYIERANLFSSGFDDSTKNKLALIGGLQLYILFINLFLTLLRLLGGRD